jgi:hypothetical protein
MKERTLSTPLVPEDLHPRALAARASLAGKHVLIIGTTGFLAKVMLSMLLERFSVKPDLRV